MKHSSPLWLWWRRHSFNIRRMGIRWIIFFCICILFFIITPNPFSSKYSKIFIDSQDAQWNSISELLERKEKILDNDLLSKEIKIIHHGKQEKQSKEPILILLFTTIFFNKKYCMLTVDRIFGSSCPSKDRCKWTCNTRQLAQADAIIFHAYDLQFSYNTIPNRTQTKPNSVWILWSDEPPSIIDYSLFKPYQFNWTISYKLNSEISIGSYGLFSKRDVPLSDGVYNQWIKKQFNSRLNGALWFVSNCKAKERLKYYYDLLKEKTTTVEGYGRCVDYYPFHFCTSGTRCERDYMSKYKYYLSFESIICRDYITEKFFKAFYHGLIPVVYGTDQNDYNNLAPPNSFIHIDEFDKDMNKLANYLQKVHLDFELYSKYHQWRKTYDVIINGQTLERIRMCELCERLNKLHKDDVTSYKNIGKFFNEKCF